MTATAIGAHSAMHKTKVSRAVAELGEASMADPKPDESDRRIEWLTLTKAGRTAYGEMVPLASDFESRMLARLGAGHAASLLGNLTALEAAMAGQGNNA